MTGDRRALPSEQVLQYKEYLKQRSETAASAVKIYAQRHSYDEDWTTEILDMLGLNDDPTDTPNMVGRNTDYDF